LTSDYAKIVLISPVIFKPSEMLTSLYFYTFIWLSVYKAIEIMDNIIILL
jgi:hypothetical protein